MYKWDIQVNGVRKEIKANLYQTAVYLAVKDEKLPRRDRPQTLRVIRRERC